ncbi:hypothetical protein CBR_g20167 [Chara braunii]|uniref:Major facilitator superfamily (MFS) profile domain-containing protein n=1 Tax=Chara braunii TaxID=69332 RepID=A0A388KZQ4_CHABU|nr:hypothetical protein CBR_g20167 [Chara braunii]|eukprot:GBG75536.1 hypothetical protein CBR_g20167 [Chara braunii]
MTPKRLLVIFCVINLINYVDRGVIASNGVNGVRGNCTQDSHIICQAPLGIQGDFDLSDAQDGLLPSAFMVGLLVASPLFAELSKTWNPFRLIGIGLGVWTLAVLGCGVAPGFYFLAVCRMFVGVGEASFVSLAAPFIDNYAPPHKKSMWLSMFYMCIPAGVALGYVYGGLITQVFSWRMAFVIEALFMLPAVVFGFLAKPLQFKSGMGGQKPVDPSTIYSDALDSSEQAMGDSEEGEAGAQMSVRHPMLRRYSTKKPFLATLLQGVKRCGKSVGAFLVDLKELLTNGVYVINAVGYTFYTAVIGAYAFWGPRAAKIVFNMASADEVFGADTVLTGIFGTFCGGVLLDRIGNTISKAFGLCAISVFFGGILCIISFLMKSQLAFIVFIALGEFLLFAIQGPVNIISLGCVPPREQALSIAMGTVAIHIFGDVPSPPVVGYIQDQVHDWRISMVLLSCLLFVASMAWAAGSMMPNNTSSTPSSSGHHTDEEINALLSDTGRAAGVKTMPQPQS